jgi:hypothetical protein
VAGIDDDVEHDEHDQDDYLGAAKDVLESAILADWQQVDEENNQQEDADPDAGVGRQSSGPLQSSSRIANFGKISRVEFELENAGNRKNFSSSNGDPGEPVKLARPILLPKDSPDDPAGGQSNGLVDEATREFEDGTLYGEQGSHLAHACHDGPEMSALPIAGRTTYHTMEPVTR